MLATSDPRDPLFPKHTTDPIEHRLDPELSAGSRRAGTRALPMSCPLLTLQTPDVSQSRPKLETAFGPKIFSPTRPRIEDP